MYELHQRVFPAQHIVGWYVPLHTSTQQQLLVLYWDVYVTDTFLPPGCTPPCRFSSGSSINSSDALIQEFYTKEVASSSPVRTTNRGYE
jgi:hypothetical protein